MTRILIVDDEPTQARALARAFSRLRPELTILTASNGVEAATMMGERSIDLLLTDLQMPEMDGFEQVAWILSNHPDVSVFTMSAYGSHDTAARLSSLGAIEYFTKPIDPKAALARLTDTLSQSVRGHVQNVSLASFLQLMEMERKSRASDTAIVGEANTARQLATGQIAAALLGCSRLHRFSRFSRSRLASGMQQIGTAVEARHGRRKRRSSDSSSAPGRAPFS